MKLETIGAPNYSDNPDNTKWGTNTLYFDLNSKYYCDNNCGDDNSKYSIYKYNYIKKNSYYGNMIQNVYWGVGSYDFTGDFKDAFTYEISDSSVQGYIGIPSAYDYEISISNHSSWFYRNNDEWFLTSTPRDYGQVLRLYGGYKTCYSYRYSGCGYGTGGLYIRPTMYLKSSVYVISGTGTRSDPYVIGM